MRKLNKKRFAAYGYSVFRFLLIFGLCYLILKPFIIQFLGACMSVEDLNDITVEKIPKHFSTFHWEKAINMLQIPVAGTVTLCFTQASPSHTKRAISPVFTVKPPKLE